MKRWREGGRRPRISHRKTPSNVVLFQVCIRFVFQPIMLGRARRSFSPLGRSARASEGVLVVAPEENPEAHKRRIVGPEVERTVAGDREGDRRGGRGEEGEAEVEDDRRRRISIANYNIMLLTRREIRYWPLSIQVSAASRKIAVGHRYRVRARARTRRSREIRGTVVFLGRD